MCTIRLSEVLYGKDYPEAGASLYEIIMQNKDSADKIVISMEGVSSIPSMFLNVSIGRYIEEFKKSGADMLTVHAEACKHLDSTLREIRKAGMKVGVAINPGTPVSQLECVLDLVDMVLIMTVNPGFGGQSYIESCTGKVQKLQKMITEAGLNVDIQVDGGINEKTIDKVLDAGANILVAGSAVFGGNIGENVRCLKEKMESR